MARRQIDRILSAVSNSSNKKSFRFVASRRFRTSSLGRVFFDSRSFRGCFTAASNYHGEKSCQLGNAIRVSRSNDLAGIAVFTQNRWTWIEEGTIVGSNDLQREFNCSIDGIERMQDTSRPETKERFVDSSVYTSRY